MKDTSPKPVRTESEEALYWRSRSIEDQLLHYFADATELKEIEGKEIQLLILATANGQFTMEPQINVETKELIHNEVNITINLGFLNRMKSAPVIGLIHNHPSGNMVPGVKDIATIKAMEGDLENVREGGLLGIVYTRQPEGRAFTFFNSSGKVLGYKILKT